MSVLEYWNVGHNLCLASVALTMAHGAKVLVHGLEQPCRVTTLSYAYKTVVEQTAKHCHWTKKSQL